MHARWLVGVVAAAHDAVSARLAAAEVASVSMRRERLAQLAATMHATARAEEQVLFPAARRALHDDVLIDSCTAEHRDVASRLATLAGHPDGPGFASAISAFSTDVHNHMRDETDAVVPLLAEALGAEDSAALAADFERALAAG